MTGAAQHGLHPNAERLNAFAEQALGEGERGEVLQHLAVCGRCRQVVALAREAVEEEVYEHAAAAAPPRPALQPDGWWKRWRVVWVPAAVTTAVAVTSLSVYLRQVEQRATAIRIAEQPQNKAAAPASAAPPAEIAEAAPPASPVQAAPAPQKRTAQRPSAPLSRQRLDRSPMIVDKLPSIGGAPAPELPLPAENASPELGGTGFLTAGRPASYQSSAAVERLAEKKEQAIKKQPVQTSAVYGGLFDASAAPVVGEKATGSSAAGVASNQAAVTAERSALRPASAASFGALGQLKAGVLSTARIASPFHLPSGLRIISMASSGERKVALDEADALFVSTDSGKTWERVATQWTGRPVMVRRAPDSSTQPEPLAAQSAGSQAAATEPVPPTRFEMVNDEGQVWLSADGKVWKAK